MTYSRKPGLFNLSQNYEVLADAPLDARTTTPYYSGLTDGNLKYPYSGMTVLVYADETPANNGLWYCTYPGGGVGTATTLTTQWTKIGGTSITGGTYDESSRILSFSGANNNGFTVDGDLLDGYGLSNLYLDPTNLILSATTRNGTILTANTTPLTVDNYVTGGTYDFSAGTITFFSLTGGGFPVSGFTTGLTMTTGATYDGNTGIITFNKTAGQPYTAEGFNYVTGFTVNDVTNSISGYTNISGATVAFGGTITAVTGGTFSNGNLYLSGTGLISSGVTITGFSGGTNYTGGTSSAGTGATTAITATLYSSGNSVSVPIDMSDAFKFTNLNPVRRTVGGIANTSSPFISGKTMHQIIQEIFYPNDPPTIVDADGALSRTAGVTTPYGIIGQVVNMTLNAVYTSGTSTATGQGTVSTGAMSAFTYNGGGLSNVTDFTTSPTDTTNDNSYEIVQGTNQWSCVFTFNVGGQPVDVDGLPFSSSQTSQFTNPTPLTATTSFEGVYPISATSSSLNSLTQQTLVSASANSVIIPLVAETDGTYRQRFITPNNMGTVASINYPDILGNFTSDNFISQFTIGTTNVDVNSNATNVLYNTYTYNAGIRQNLNIRVNFN